MSLPDPLPPRKPRRRGLYAPFILLLIAVIAWSGFWFYARMEAGRRLDAGAAELRKAGYEVTWERRSLGGYPFRLDVTLTRPSIRDPSGWALSAPRLEAEAFMHGLGHWIIAAPQGATFTRPAGGPVTVNGQLIRASLSDFDKTPPSFSFEGVKLTFQPAPGARPFALAAAERVEFHLRSGPGDQGGLMFKLDKGKTQASGLFARIAGDQPVSMIWESTLTKVSGFKGRTWPQSARAWSDGGGQIDVRQAGVTAGEALLGARAGTLTVGADGRLRGSLDLNLRQAPRALGALGASGVIPPETALAAAAVTAARQDEDDVARAQLTFQAGQTTLGPIAIAPAPRVY
jgi:hypothetical protein